MTMNRLRRLDLFGLPSRAILIGTALCLPAHAQFVQQGAKLVGAGATGPSGQGYSVGLSGDGNTAIVGGLFDGAQAVPAGYTGLGPGAAWIFTRSGANWSQQGPKLTGSGGAGTPSQGYSVAMSGDGNTAVVGGNADGALAQG